MNFSRTISTPIILLLIAVTVMVITGVRGFMRLAPSIEQINLYNTQSLYLAESMISSISVEHDINSFENALTLAQKNITEPGEKEIIQNIEKKYKSAFSGDKKDKELVINDINKLSAINRSAVQKTILKIKKLTAVGSYVIVFVGLIIWALGLVLLNTLKKTLISPLSELKEVLQNYSKGNKLRRCPAIAPTKDFQQIYDNLNALLDKLAKK